MHFCAQHANNDYSTERKEREIKVSVGKEENREGMKGRERKVRERREMKRKRKWEWERKRKDGEKRERKG